MFPAYLPCMYTATAQPDPSTSVLTLQRAFTLVESVSQQFDDQSPQSYLRSPHLVCGDEPLLTLAEAGRGSARLGFRCEVSMGFLRLAEAELRFAEAVVRDRLRFDPTGMHEAGNFGLRVPRWREVVKDALALDWECRRIRIEITTWQAANNTYRTEWVAAQRWQDVVQESVVAGYRVRS